MKDQDCMKGVAVHFILQITDEDLDSLLGNHKVISKLILSPDDYKLFQYEPGDRIQVESDHGHRLWSVIENIEILIRDERAIIILTLVNEPATQ